MKESYYFPHDYNAKNDPKCQALINDFNYEGYGLYWRIIEIMHEQGGKIKKFPKLYDGLAYQFNIKKELLVKLIEAMLHEYELLLQDENYIWSNRVLRNIEERKQKYLLRSEAGRLGGLKSGKIRSKTKQWLKQNEAVVEANEAKERKRKEKKRKEMKELIIKGKNFIPPKLEEVKKYCDERKNEINSEHFINYYESRGWMIGKNKMKNWQAAVRTWENNNKDNKNRIKLHDGGYAINRFGSWVLEGNPDIIINTKNYPELK